MLRLAAARAAPRARGRAARHLSTASSAGDAAAAVAYRRFGHVRARLDPLGITPPSASADLDAAAAGASPAMVAHLEAVYCGPLGAEFEHLESSEERAWWASQLETLMPAGAPGAFVFSIAAKKNAWSLVEQAEQFELFLGRKFTSLKRYSGEGTESLLPAMNEVFASAAAAGVRDVVIGMAHRGRLALLASLLNYPVRKLLYKIMGNDDLPDSVQGLDDVSSHVASSTEREYPGGRLHVSLLHNPSHLEFVNPVAAGKTRAKQEQGSDGALCLLVHGDAAVSAQGIVAETYAMSLLPGYSVGGTVHIVTNNQVGFTAEGALSGRSSRYASDMAKVAGAPVLHVNAESLREVALAARLAVAYRSAFRKDVVLDLIGFRRHGHNELDEPAFTSPRMWAAIRALPSFPSRLAAALEGEGVLAPGARAAMASKLSTHLEAEFAAAAGGAGYTRASGSLGVAPPPPPAGAPPPPGGLVVADGSAFGGKWAGIRQAAPAETLASPPTGVALEALRGLAAASVRVPPGFRVHERLLRGHVAPRLAAVGLGEAPPAPAWSASAASIDWATAEALALGSLLSAGHDVRLSGQDSQRGTFSHRHAVLHDQASGAQHAPLGALGTPGAGRLSAVSSLLSEMAVLGFEYGYSWESPSPLVLWEAQFGDFANGAQGIIDAFIASGESKWLRASALTLLLPHGYDGAGPEHSSARIERFLQLVNAPALSRPGAAGAAAADKACSEAINLLVANPTTPAQYFHLLRRQVLRAWRKPLILIAPKTLIRHPQALSRLADFAPGAAFAPVLADALGPGGGGLGAPGTCPLAAPQPSVSRVLLVCGKLYYELAKRRADLARADVGILRVEELAPFPTAEVLRHLTATYPAVKSLAWVQEEPANAGAWAFAEAHLTPALAEAALPRLTYVGRPALAAPAVGLSKANKLQQEALLEAAIPRE